MGKAKVQ